MKRFFLAGSLSAAALGFAGTLAAQQAVTSPAMLSKPGTVIEAESLLPLARASAGNVIAQNMHGFGPQWGQDSQIFWRPPAPVDTPIRNWPSLTLPLEAPRDGKYAVTIYFTAAPDYGNVRAFLRGQAVGDYPGYAPAVGLNALALGERNLKAGSNQLVLTVFGKASASSNYFVGIDRIELRAPAVPPTGANSSAFASRAIVTHSADTQDSMPPPQRVENLDVNQLASIAQATRLPNGMKRSRQLDSIVAQLQQDNTATALESWNTFIAGNRQPDGQPVDVNALIQWVLRASYAATQADLMAAAEKVKYYNEMKKKLRDEIQRAQTELSEERPWPRDRRVVVFPQGYTEDAVPVEHVENRRIDKQDLRAILDEYGRLLRTVGEDAQLQNIEMQNVLQKQQQTLQMMSQISKQLHDTAMAVIRKIGG